MSGAVRRAGSLLTGWLFSRFAVDSFRQAVNQKVLPWPGNARHTGIAAHHPGQLVADGEAETGAAVAAGGRIVSLFEGA